MLRILKFIGAFLGTLLIILLIVFGFHPDAIRTLVENSDDLQEGSEWVAKASSLKGLTEYIGAHPGRVSLLSVSPTAPDSALSYGPHAPRAMGTLSNFLLLAEYARRVEEGTLDSLEAVPLDSVDRHQLPYVDASSHERAVNALRGRGQVSRERTVPLSRLVQAAVAHNDLAASDYLWFRLAGPEGENLDRLAERLGLGETERPLPFSGLYILMNSRLQDRPFPAHLDSLARLPREEYGSRAIRAARRFALEGGYRERVLESFRSHEGPGIGFSQRRDALALFPKSTAADLAGLMERLLENRLLSPAVSRRIKAFMDWPLEGRLKRDFSEYGAIYDSRLGMAAGMDYGVSASSGRSYAQALLFDPLQVAFWFHLSSNLMHQDFQQRLIWDPALRVAARKAISPARDAANDTTQISQ